MENWALRNSIKSWLSVPLVSELSVKQILLALLKKSQVEAMEKGLMR